MITIKSLMENCSAKSNKGVLGGKRREAVVQARWDKHSLQKRGKHGSKPACHVLGGLKTTVSSGVQGHRERISKGGWDW